MKKTGYFIGILSVLALIMLIAGCGGGGGGGGGEAPPPATPSCAEQGGNVCSANEECDGGWVTAADTRKCCSGNCITQGEVNKTCEEQGGNICSIEEKCYEGYWIEAKEQNCCKDGACCERIIVEDVTLASGGNSIDADVEKLEDGTIRVWYGEEAGEVGRVSFADASLVSGNIYSAVIEKINYQFEVSYPNACKIEAKSVEVPPTECTDSDITDQYPDGKNYYVKGTTVGIRYPEDPVISTFVDMCHKYTSFYEQVSECSPPDCYTSEFYCDEISYVGEEMFLCENGCQDGACIAAVCIDGTGYSQCSSTKPKYCDNGSLVDECSICDCDAGQECQNNGSCITAIPKPDLMIESITFIPEKANVDEAVNTNVAIKNSGEAENNGFSLEVNFGDGTEAAVVESFASLAPNKTLTLSVEHIYPIGGEYDIYALVSAFTPESNENNNELAEIIYISGKPICTDSDDGRDYYAAGETCIDGDCVTDYCENKTELWEYYCIDTNLRDREKYACLYSCEVGVCNKDTTPPTITIISPESGSTARENQVLFELTTDEDATCWYVSDKLDLEPSQGTAHSQLITNLENRKYSIEINCIDAAGNSATEDLTFDVYIKAIEGYLTLAADKRWYSIGDMVKLTDPPQAEEKELYPSPYGEALLETKSEERVGFIIQFKEEPTLVKKIELEEEIKETIKKSEEYKKEAEETIIPLLKDYKNWRASNLEDKANEDKSNLPDKVEERREEILEEHRNALDDIKQKVHIDGTIGEYTDVFNGVGLDISEEEAEKIKESGYVEAVYPNYKVHTTLIESVPVIKADSARESFNVDGSGVTISVIDTGIDASHKSLDDLDDSPETDDPKVIAFKDFVNFIEEPYDDHGHGTHVAGISAGTGGNSDYIGVAPGARIVGVKVLDESGSGSFSDVIKGIEWTAQNKDNYNISIISMSLGANINSDGTTPVELAADLAVDSGINFVVAAGNAGPSPNTVGIPASAKNVITIGAIDNNMEIAGFSSRGPTADGRIKPEVTAVGVDVTAPEANSGNNYVTWSGTSMATPHVAGVAALILEASPTIMPLELRSILMNTSIDKGDTGPDNTYGWGVVDAIEALMKVKPPEHDIGIYNMQFPKWAQPASLIEITAILKNNGANNETEVVVHFLVNGIEQNSTNIISISAGSELPINFSWTPVEEETYDITIKVDQLAGEDIIINNEASGETKVVYSTGTVKAVILDSWCSNFMQYCNLGYVEENWYLFGDYTIELDYLNKEDITYDDIAASNADVLIISDAWNDKGWPGAWEFTDSEIGAIKKYVEEGHGIIATSGTLSEYTPNNIKLASLFGINQSVIGLWNTFDHYFNTRFNIFYSENPVFNKISMPYYSGNSMSVLNLQLNTSDPGLILAKSIDEKALIIEYDKTAHNLYFTHMAEYSDAFEDEQMIYNAVLWASAPFVKKDHDILLYDLNASGILKYNQSVDVRAYAKNKGENAETNVTARFLVDNKEEDSTIIASIGSQDEKAVIFSWMPEAVGSYNITISADEIAPETLVFDNVLTKTVVVPGASFNDQYFDHGVDTDGDGLYNYLAIDAGVDVIKEGYYNVMLDLYSAFGAELVIGNNYTYLPEGAHNVVVFLDGMELYKIGLNGPYNIKYLHLYNNKWEEIDYREDAYSTAAYRYDEFQKMADIAGYILWSAEKIVVNSSTTINAIIKNIGNEIAVNATALLYEVAEDGEGGLNLIGIVEVGDLAAGIEKSASFGWIPTKIGWQELKFVVNATNDGNLENNINYGFVDVLPNAPDVTAYIEWKNKAIVNQSSAITAWVRNQGVQTASDVKASLYEKEWINGEEALTLIEEATIGALAVDEEQKIIFDWMPSEIGWQELKLIVNATNDGNLENNIYYSSVDVVPNAPDIKGYFYFDKEVIVNQTTNINAVVENIGIYDAPNVTASLYEIEWVNGTEAFRLIGIISIGTLAVDEEQKIIFDWMPSEIGWQELRMVMNATDDGNLENNVAYGSADVLPNAPDIRGYIKWKDHNLVVNQLTNITTTVGNGGIYDAYNATAGLYESDWEGEEEQLNLIGEKTAGVVAVGEEIELVFDYTPAKTEGQTLKLIVSSADDGNLDNNINYGWVNVVPKSMINNTGAEDISGYLLMKVEEYLGIVINDILEEGETKTYTTSKKSYEVTVTVITDTGTSYVKFNINGETTESLKEGDSMILSDGTELNVKQILPNEAGDVTQDSAEFSLTKEWEEKQIVAEDRTPRTIAAGSYLALDKIWDEAGAYTATEEGEFSVYVALTDEDSNVIQTSDGSYLEAVYDFSIG